MNLERNNLVACTSNFTVWIQQALKIHLSYKYSLRQPPYTDSLLKYTEDYLLWWKEGTAPTYISATCRTS